MKKSGIIALVFFVVIVISGIYLLLRKPTDHQQIAPAQQSAVAVNGKRPSWSPPIGQPLISSYSELLAHAEAGDAKAATRLFEDVSECLQVNRLDSALQQLSENKNWLLNGGPAGATRPYDAVEQERAIDAIDREMSRIEGAGELCSGMKDIDDGRIYGIGLQAARLGDTKAIACLLMAPYKSPPVSDGQGHAFANELIQLGEKAIKKGDWNAAIAMTFVYSGTGGRGYSAYVTRIDPIKEYEYSALVRLGTLDGSPDAAHLDRRLSILSDQVPPNERAAAELRAQDIYKHYYFHSGPVFPDSSPCEF